MSKDSPHGEDRQLCVFLWERTSAEKKLCSSVLLDTVVEVMFLSLILYFIILKLKDVDTQGYLYGLYFI